MTTVGLYAKPLAQFSGTFYSSFSKVCFIPRCIQFIHTSSNFYAVDKLLLSKLRKKTGFPISHCKKALELHESDLQQAEEWLIKEAQAHGWAKATKLSGRATSQGLVAVHIKDNIGSLVEVNCETDFVAKNADFQALVSKVAEELALSSGATLPDNLEHPVKEFIDKETLSGLQTSDGNTLADVVALTIGKIGENIQISRGVRYISPPSLDLIGYAHPSRKDGAGLIGRYGAVVAFKNTSNAELIRELCAHIVGMNPDKVGSFEDLKEEEKVSEEEVEKKSSDKEEEEGERVAEKEERTLLRQEFLSDIGVTVGQVLKDNDISVIDFVRLECGGSLGDGE